MAAQAGACPFFAASIGAEDVSINDLQIWARSHSISATQLDAVLWGICTLHMQHSEAAYDVDLRGRAVDLQWLERETIAFNSQNPGSAVSIVEVSVKPFQLMSILMYAFEKVCTIWRAYGRPQLDPSVCTLRLCVRQLTSRCAQGKQVDWPALASSLLQLDKDAIKERISTARRLPQLVHLSTEEVHEKCQRDCAQWLQELWQKLTCILTVGEQLALARSLPMDMAAAMLCGIR